MKCWRKNPQRRAVVATVVALVWLPYAGTRCLENPSGPSGAEGSVNCIFHHESHGSAAGHHHDDGGPGAAAGHHDHHRDDTCCTQTGKRSVIPSTSGGSEPPGVLGGGWLASWYRPQRADHLEPSAPVPVAHSPPLYLRNASLLI